MQAALQAQQDARFLDAMILLDDERKSGKVSGDAEVELNLLRASFLLQGNQSRETLETLAPLLSNTQHAADAYALTAMAHLQQGQMQEALNAAQRGQSLGGGILPHLALSYSLQGMGRLAEARDVMHGFNTQTPQSAIALAREAELALTLDQIQPAETLASQARQIDAAHSYVIAVSGLVYLIDGHAREAKAAFEAALKRDPKDAKALLGAGLAESKLGNLKAGQEKLQAANDADPNNALILTYLGRSQLQAGDTKSALASWHSAQQADPKDPMPWLYQAQAELAGNQPMAARASLQQAQERIGNRAVYRGERLLKEDRQVLDANLAEVQRQLGMEGLAFQTLDDSIGEKSPSTLRNQADVLQGQRFAESARRSLVLQSMFNERPGNLPAELDIYGDGAGQTGATTPQHGAVSELSAQQASYNNYDELFGRRAALEADGIKGSQNTTGEQIRAGVGSDTLGMGIAQRQFKTDGSAPFESLDNRIWQGIAQWRLTRTTQVFISHQSFDSTHGETFYPADPLGFGSYNMIEDKSKVTRLGLRHSLSDSSELRGLWSYQQTDQTINSEFIGNTLPYSNMPPFFGPTLPFPQFSQYASSSAHSVELQYRSSGPGYTTQWGVQQTRGEFVSVSANMNLSTTNQQFYMARQQALGPQWQLDAGLGWGKIDKQDNLRNLLDNSTYLSRWLPKLGIVYAPDAASHVRLAAWQGMGASGAGDATLAPVSLAGVVLSRPGDDGRVVRAVALGADRQLNPSWLLDAEAQQRRTELPGVQQTGQILSNFEVDESKLMLHWQPQDKPLGVSLAYDYERTQNDPQAIALDSVNEQTLRSQQLELRWLAGEQWRVNLKWSHNQVNGTQKSTDLNTFMPILLGYQDSFNQVDAGVSWQFNRARDVLIFGVRNAAGTNFKYLDTDPLNPRFSNGRLGYAKLKLAW